MARTKQVVKTFADALFLNGGNAKAAAIACGFKETSASARGSEMMKVPEVIAMLEEKRQALSAKASITVEDLLIEYKAILYLDPIYIFKEDGRIKNMQDIPPSIRRCISSIDLDEYGHVKSVKFWNKNKAMDEVMKHLGGYEVDNGQKAAKIFNDNRTQIVFK